ncbi:GTPase activating protein, putative [Trypanosoma equiperdum]|uniref:GTPase activating protein, putative n=1 Tax=Trypanosoma equiperdum TaxID=5694 RepID=A0A1G4I1H3_TRYEQ|nr:GTPase activating protein, putative [Trypanosoma equiperdum]
MINNGLEADKPRTLKEFAETTGLKMEQAKKCFDGFGGYAPALASFAQSYTTLPDNFFEDKERAVKNAAVINAELKLIYKRAREIKERSGEGDKDVWGSYYKHLATLAPKQQEKQPPSAPPQPTEPPKSIFGFCSAAFPTQSPATVNFGFGEAPVNSTGSQTFGKPNFQGFGQAAKPVEKTNDKPRTEQVKYCKPKYFTGPFFDMPLFWEEEVEALCPLLNLNGGFLEENRGGLRGRLERWVTKASFYRQPVQYIEIDDEDEETVRVIIKDADRTFFHPDHRKKFVSFLNAMSHEFKAYGQAMSYLAGICLLVLNEEETAAVLRFVSKEYIPGHWAAEAVGFATSAWVVEHFMKRKFPDVAKHLEDLKFWPDTYLQKILTGLCVHVLSFKDLFVFLDLFIDGGINFLIKFCLAVVERFRSSILRVKSANDANTLYEIMRLDSKVTDSNDIKEILQRARLMELGDEELSIDVLRSKAFDEHVAPRLQRAPKTEAFEPCEVCNERKPKWWNEDIGAVCTECKEAAPGLTYTKY